MNARQDLLEQGYVILYNAVPAEMVDNLRSAARHDDLAWSNGTWNGEEFDPNRQRATLPDSLCRVLMVALRPLYLTFFPHASAHEWTFWRTIAGAADEPVRRDFQPPPPGPGVANLSALPALLLMATQNDTVLYGYGWNRLVAIRSNAYMLHLNKGDVIMFRGDFMYAPAGYIANNPIVQGYLDTPFYQRQVDQDQSQAVVLIDDVSAVDDLFCYVYNCPFVANGNVSLRKHLNRFHHLFFRRPRH